jgi:hypothetical protein
MPTAMLLFTKYFYQNNFYAIKYNVGCCGKLRARKRLSGNKRNPKT